MNENETYINADEFSTIFDTMYDSDGEFLTDDYIDGFNDAMLAIIKRLDAMPKIDVAPVKHGHWVLTQRTKIVPTDKIGLKENFITCKNGTLVNENNINKKAMIIKKQITIVKPKCSECGYYGYDEDDITPYCPNCGAKMDEK